MANNRVWLVCRGCLDEPLIKSTPEDPYPERFLIGKHFMSGWQRREHMPELVDWLAKHEDCFFDRSGKGTESDPWDHQFVLEYEDDHVPWPKREVLTEASQR